MIVQNISGRDIKVPEMRKVIKAGSAYISLPYSIALRYKSFLKPIQMSDTLMNTKLENKQTELEDNKTSKSISEDTNKNFIPEVIGIKKPEVEDIEEILEEVEEKPEPKKKVAKKKPAAKKKVSAKKKSTKKAESKKSEKK